MITTGASSPSSARASVSAATRTAASLQRLVAELAERVDDLAAELAALSAAPPAPPGSLLTVDQAAVALGVSRSRVFALIKAGALHSIKLGASRRIPREAVDQLVISLAKCQTAACHYVHD